MFICTCTCALPLRSPVHFYYILSTSNTQRTPLSLHSTNCKPRHPPFGLQLPTTRPSTRACVSAVLLPSPCHVSTVIHHPSLSLLPSPRHAHARSSRHPFPSFRSGQVTPPFLRCGRRFDASEENRSIIYCPQISSGARLLQAVRRHK